MAPFGINKRVMPDLESLVYKSPDFWLKRALALGNLEPENPDSKEEVDARTFLKMNDNTNK